MHSGFSGKCCRRERLLFPQRHPDRDNRYPGALLIPDTFRYTLHLPEKPASVRTAEPHRTVWSL